ncbi:MAG TPA: sulfatase-like hydrolase/transferase, partial [Allosphingosinicella sp.]|nr:sulfatase-like hydrolase/transferase [Allosphingosinicella sp.]
ADWRRPTFLYLNIQEAHFPYAHPDMPRFLPGRLAKRSEIRAANREMVERTYWNSVAYSDWLVGQVLGRLKAQGVYERTLVMVTGDHGEALFEEGFLGHGHVLDRAQTQVPFILSDPAVKVAGPIGLADYRAILLRALSGDVAPRPAKAAVFQYIGTLDRPGLIGIVEPGGVWTTLNLETEELWFSDSGRRVRYRELAAGSPEKVRADRLVDEWARQRWLARQ